MEGRQSNPFADSVASDEGLRLGLLGGKRDFYCLASLALGEIFQKTPLRRIGIAEILTEWFAGDAPSH